MDSIQLKKDGNFYLEKKNEWRRGGLERGKKKEVILQRSSPIYHKSALHLISHIFSETEVHENSISDSSYAQRSPSKR